jgi:hypothetical protein
VWEVDDDDIAELKKAVDDECNEDEGMLLGGMLEVIERFQAFSDSFDEFLEVIDGAGLTLGWEHKGREWVR